ncbi:Na+/H+ antiporter NhaC family protein [Desulfosporosinus sp. PR]|uniref:Na+/H+ antiporter NhaC family protein n=1 Tax=Candidatus Desulfosporosinus nitrosoreducens TaxID=3401928 RepID=UPI0027EFFF72|nr:Na+/H+ antiporter NhaC family protein [Desulfosporosinus sp. PR]MDQ7095183.1 Na+/H+ antiporter NhaC family protein [Desulfosporosinus sp. PR]
MHGTVWSLLPFLVVIPLALFTRQVLPGLVVGLFIGAYMLSPTPFGGIDTALQYILKELAISDNLRLIVFMYGFGAFVGLVRVTGGVSGFARLMEEKIHSGRGAFIVTWLSSLLTFMAPDFRIITVGPVMKQVFSRLKVPVDKVAFVVDATATPLCAIMPLGTVFIGYSIGLLSTVSRHQGVVTPPYNLFLLSIPFNFFSLAMLVFAFLYSFRKTKPDKAQAKEGEPASQPVESLAKMRALGSAQLAYGETSMELAIHPPMLTRKNKVKRESEIYPDPVELVAEKVAPNALNLIVPLALLLSLTLFFTWWDGHLHASGLLGALIQANAAKAMLEALLTTLIVSFVWYAFQEQPIQRTLFGFLQGGNEMMAVNVLLVFVWAVSAVSTDLGFVTYTERTVGSLVPAALIAPAFFVLGCLLSYVIGSTFGTWGILLPLGFSLATTEHAALPLIAGAVFASGTFGGFVSPLSDNTVAMATVMKIPVMDYAKLKLRLGLMVAAVCTVIYGLVGWFYRGA